MEWIRSHFKIKAGTRIADFGCGPGLYTTRLAALGAKVTGIDFSARSIEHAPGVAAQSGLTIDYVLQNYLDFETQNRFDFILMTRCDFCALGPSQHAVMLEKFRSMLGPDGSVLLDVYSLNAFNQREEASLYGLNLLDGFCSAKKYYGFLNTFKYDAQKVILDKYPIIEAGRRPTGCIISLRYHCEMSLRRQD